MVKRSWSELRRSQTHSHDKPRDIIAVKIDMKMACSGQFQAWAGEDPDDLWRCMVAEKAGVGGQRG